METTLIEHIRSCFINEFESEPLLIFSPGRINLIGEHTDYNDGFVFPAAINKGIVAAIQESDSKYCTAYAVDNNEKLEFLIENIKPIENGGWRNYVLGVIAEIKKKGINLKPFNIAFGGDIPSGAGMSSSAALENSIVFSLNEIFNLNLSKSEMIDISQKAEHLYVGVKCGIMDQYASMFGQKNTALLLDCRTVESVPFKIDFSEYQLLFINTNVKHNLSESAYNDRRTTCNKIANLLHIKALRDATENELLNLKDKISEEEYQKALYIIQENKRVIKASEAIQKNDLKTFGNLLYESHQGLKNQYEVSCIELDFLVDYTKENGNILGARMMGGGFGGCTINLIKKSEVKKFKKEILKAYQNQFDKECSIYSVKLSSGTKRIK